MTIRRIAGALAPSLQLVRRRLADIFPAGLSPAGFRSLDAGHCRLGAGLSRRPAASGGAGRGVSQLVQVAALGAREPAGHLEGPGVQQGLVVQLGVVDAGEVGDGAADDEGYQAADDRVVHVGDGVELGQRVPEIEQSFRGWLFWRSPAASYRRSFGRSRNSVQGPIDIYRVL